ncbi:MAG TPA: hypothetical protein VLU92_14835 [Candidatus Dormibacteraeota bacterium]|nr:hypothetical protein [Candidatus Dormibacteraeota bacterium]
MAGAHHVADWISIRAHAARDPLKLTVSITLGPLPGASARTEQPRAPRYAAGIVGVVLVVPFVALVGAELLRAMGLDAPSRWISSTPAAIVAASVSLLIGLPVAFMINLWPITRFGLRRGVGELEGVVALEVAPLQLGVVLVALIIGGLFAAHLAADSYACLKGVRSAC